MGGLCISGIAYPPHPSTSHGGMASKTDIWQAGTACLSKKEHVLGSVPLVNAAAQSDD